MPPTRAFKLQQHGRTAAVGISCVTLQLCRKGGLTVGGNQPPPLPIRGDYTRPCESVYEVVFPKDCVIRLGRDLKEPARKPHVPQMVDVWPLALRPDSHRQLVVPTAPAPAFHVVRTAPNQIDFPRIIRRGTLSGSSWSVILSGRMASQLPLACLGIYTNAARVSRRLCRDDLRPPDGKQYSSAHGVFFITTNLEIT